MKRILLVGANGCGKTTVGRLLSEIFGSPYADMDDMHWLPDWKERPFEEMSALVKDFTDQESWVLSGNYSKHQPITLSRADTVIWLDLPLPLCLWRTLWRAVRHIRNKEPLCNGNYDEWGRLFSWGTTSIVWWLLSTFYKKRRKYTKLFTATNKKLPKLIHLTSRKEISNLIKSVKFNKINV